MNTESAYQTVAREMFEIALDLDPALGSFSFAMYPHLGSTFVVHLVSGKAQKSFQIYNFLEKESTVAEFRQYIADLEGNVPDKYGNTEKDPFEHCSFPDCGCDGARLCQAKSGASSGAISLNIEHRSRQSRGFDQDSEMATGDDGRWIMHEPVNPGEGWRLLADGEPLREGDGLLLPDMKGRWIDYMCRPNLFRENETAHTHPWRRKIVTASTSPCE